MTKPIFQVIDGGALLSAAEFDAAIAAVAFEPVFEHPAAEDFAERAEHEAFGAAEQGTAAVAILAKSKGQLVSLIAAAGREQATEGHAALKRALAGADTLLVILRAAEARFAIALAAAVLGADHSR
jgi:hypothetical protein